MHNRFNKYIGITMRVTEASNYNEKRNSIAFDWANYMLNNFHDVKWMFLPNIGEEIINYIKSWHINAFIITGGDDIGMYSIRDKTENKILEYANEKRMPLLGVCRGMQLIHLFYGGRIIKGNSNFINLHRSTQHEILIGNKLRKVNSYHENQLEEKTISKRLSIIARSIKDESVEGIKGNNVLGLMWHPERSSSIDVWEKEMIRSFLFKG